LGITEALYILTSVMAPSMRVIFWYRI